MKKIIYILAAITIILFSCKKKIDIELNDDEASRLVVEGRFTTAKTSHTVKLTRTTSYFENEAAPVESGAIVEIRESGTNNVFTLTETLPGIYETEPDAFGKVGFTYTLYIKTQDDLEYTSEAYLDTCAQMDSVTYEYEEFVIPHGQGDTLKYYILKLWAYEPEGKGSNYMFDFYIDGSLHNDTLREAVYESDEYMDGMYLPGVDIYYIELEDLVNDSSHIQVDMLSIPKELIDYNLAVMLETDWRGSPFDGPPANIPTNISNGALGFFYAADIDSYEFDIIKEEP
jgi:hypothetical protein